MIQIFTMDAENSTIPSTAMPRLLAPIMVFHAYCIILLICSTAFYWFNCARNGGGPSLSLMSFILLRAELSELRASQGAQWHVYQTWQGSFHHRTTLESGWKFTQMTGTVHPKSCFGWRLKWLMVEPMISIFDSSRIMSFGTDDKWLGRSNLEAKSSSLLDKAQFTGGSWWRHWTQWLFVWFFLRACCH